MAGADTTRANAPRIWRYGLMAGYGAELLTGAPEAALCEEVIARVGQPVLDLACGAGRPMLSLPRCHDVR